MLLRAYSSEKFEILSSGHEENEEDKQGKAIT
jgi:hypothetical protein